MQVAALEEKTVAMPAEAAAGTRGKMAANQTEGNGFNKKEEPPFPYLTYLLLNTPLPPYPPSPLFSSPFLPFPCPPSSPAAEARAENSWLEVLTSFSLPATLLPKGPTMKNTEDLTLANEVRLALLDKLLANGFGHERILAVLEKYDRGGLEHDFDLQSIDPRHEMLQELGDILSYLTLAEVLGYYPAAELDECWEVTSLLLARVEALPQVPSSITFSRPPVGPLPPSFDNAPSIGEGPQEKSIPCVTHPVGEWDNNFTFTTEVSSYDDYLDSHSSEVVAEALRWRNKDSDRKIVFTNGCFDILHLGHLTFLSEIKNLVALDRDWGRGDLLLVVGVNSDDSARRLKDKLPFYSAWVREDAVSRVQGVDEVLVFDDERTCTILRELKPDVVIKSSEWCTEGLHPDEQAVCDELGIHVMLVPPVVGFSDTKLVEMIRTRDVR